MIKEIIIEIIFLVFVRMLSFSSPPYLHFFQTCKDTKDVSALTKAADFVKAFVLGFQVEVSDLMRLPDTQCGHFNGWVIFQTFRLFFVASEKFSFEMLSLFLPGVDLKRPSFLLSCRMHLPLSD